MHHQIAHTGSLRSIAQRSQMVLVGMHAAIADEAEEMETLALGFFKGFHKHRHGGQFAIADAFVDAGQILIHHASRAEIEVAHFAVAHLAVGQAHVFAAGTDGAHRIGGIEVVVVRGAGQQGGIAIGYGLSFTAGVDAPAVTDNENNRFFGHGYKVNGSERRCRQAPGQGGTPARKAWKHPFGQPDLFLSNPRPAPARRVRSFALRAD